MSSWQLDRVATVYRRRSPATDFGDHDDATEVVCQIWFKLLPLRMDERLNANQVAGNVTHRIVTRIQPVAINSMDWLESKGKRYEFVGITELAGYTEYLDILAIEQAVHDEPVA